MAERHPPASNGILSGVFNYVADEVGSFITNATGGVITVNTSRTSQTRVKSSRSSVERHERRKKNVREGRSSFEGDADSERRGQGRRSSERSGHSPDSLRVTRDTSSGVENHDTHRNQSGGGTRHSPLSIRSEGEAQAEASTLQAARTPTPVSYFPQETTEHHSSDADRLPLPLTQRKQHKQAVTMPGSLFPRSPSLAPTEAGESDFQSQSLYPFDSIADLTSRAGPSNHRYDASETSPFRKPLIPSVKAAVSRFQTSPDGAKPSILLPSPSPSQSRSKGKAKAHFIVVDSDDDDYQDSLLMPPPPVRKGNVRVEYTDFNDGDTSGELRVKGKERELVEAKEEHRRNQRRWERDKTEDEETRREKERDKEKIKMLEEEVARLKEELSKRPVRHPTPLYPIPPPPPPPPPPPLGLNLRAPVSDSDAPFAGARAALKHAPTPVEAPINPLRRHGQPTVGITADKMAAFLNEMKTVRLRKVSSATDLGSSRSMIANTSSTSLDESSRLSIGTKSRDLNNLSSRRSAMYSSSAPSTSTPIPPLTGALKDLHTRGSNTEETLKGKGKRKRTGSESLDIRHELENLAKRRSLASPSDSSSATSTSNSNPLSDNTASTSSHSYTLPPGTTFPSRAWAPSAIMPVDTPSLCSDNDAERGETSPDPDDRLPSTPPVASALDDEGHEPRVMEKRVHLEDPEIVDFDIEMDDGSRKKTSSKSLASQRPATPFRKTIPAFSKRPPTSPLPALSPNRPRPPARPVIPRILPPTPPQPRSSESDDEDPLTLKFMSRNSSTSSLRPNKRSSASSKSGSRRRQTLDEELRLVDMRSLQRENGDADELESGVLTGVGLREQRGFLAHGGAGGPPVYMGVGYVQGAEEDGDNHGTLANDGTEESKRLDEYLERHDADDEDEVQPDLAPRTKPSRIAVSSTRRTRRR